MGWSRGCNNLGGVLNAKELQALSTIGLSVSRYSASFTIFTVIIACIWSVVGFLIFWRRSDDWLALLAAFALVTFSITPSGNPPYALALAYAILALPLSLVGFLGQVSAGAFLLLFPNGRFVPRWMDYTAALHHRCILKQLPFPYVTFRNEWPRWHLLVFSCSMEDLHFCTNLPLQTRVHACS